MFECPYTSLLEQANLVIFSTFCLFLQRQEDGVPFKLYKMPDFFSSPISKFPSLRLKKKKRQVLSCWSSPLPLIMIFLTPPNSSVMMRGKSSLVLISLAIRYQVNRGCLCHTSCTKSKCVISLHSTFWDFGFSFHLRLIYLKG